MRRNLWAKTREFVEIFTKIGNWCHNTRHIAHNEPVNIVWFEKMKDSVREISICSHGVYSATFWAHSFYRCVVYSIPNRGKRHLLIRGKIISNVVVSSVLSHDAPAHCSISVSVHRIPKNKFGIDISNVLLWRGCRLNHQSQGHEVDLSRVIPISPCSLEAYCCLAKWNIYWIE